MPNAFDGVQGRGIEAMELGLKYIAQYLNIPRV
jgi:hypothetical protein